jgi:hypothetical protein
VYRLAVETASLSRAALVVAAVVAAAAFASARGRSDRERRIAGAFVAVSAAYAFSVISALYYAIAYSNYPSHDTFTQGLRSEAFGALGVVVAAALIAAAFRRSSRAGTGADATSGRERRLSRAAWILTASYLIIAFGEAQIAVGSTEIGYTGISEAASWAGFVAGLVAAAAMAVAAAGFRRPQRA